MAQHRRNSLAPRSPLAETVAQLPATPGVYLFKDAGGRVLYVGKANSLKHRVGSYFQPGRDIGARLAHLVRDVRAIEHRQAGSEAEALVIEAQLIKEHQPRYNVAFRDDKTYPYLKVTVQETFPRLLLTRRHLNDGARYFGPFTDVGTLRQALQLMRRVFPLRTCAQFPKSPCLEYFIGQCLAPCVGTISEPAYQRIVNHLLLFLEGKRDQLLHDLTRQMEAASREQRFEEAGRLRDTLRALSSIALTPSSTPWLSPLEQLQRALRLTQLPRRIEAFDISTLFGRESVGSMVTFVEGKPAKASYRRFLIQGQAGIDDYRMMREVVRRRYGGSLAQELPLPDLMVIDGGKGHLSSAQKELQALGLERVPVIGVAKQFEYLYLPQQPRPIILLPESPVLHLIQRIRDEAHRFAITYHRKVRRRRSLTSSLDEVPGLGPKRRQALLKRFGSLERLRQASADELAQVIGQRIADTLRARLSEKIV